MARKFKFEKATKHETKARVALIGPSGAGKTYSALAIAEGLAGAGGRIAVIDTERKSARKYSDRFAFDVLELEHFAPATYVEAIEAAEAEGFDVLVIDSLSHAWIGKGGALEQVDEAARKSKGQNSFAAWRHVTPQHNALVEALVRCKCHLVVTMRAKTEYVLEQNERGKQTPRKVGLAPVQREGLEYEFDVVGEIDLDHDLVVSKSRCSEFAGKVVQRPDAKMGAALLRWLSDGAPAPVEAPKPRAEFAPAAPAPQQPATSTDTDPVREALAAAVTVMQGAGDTREPDAIKRAVWGAAKAIGQKRAARGEGPRAIIAEDITAAVEQLTAPESSEVAS